MFITSGSGSKNKFMFVFVLKSGESVPAMASLQGGTEKQKKVFYENRLQCSGTYNNISKNTAFFSSTYSFQNYIAFSKVTRHESHRTLSIFDNNKND